ncbi:MAG: hypothetical protein LUG91_07490 [Ruminococcus sp.]|nr:hypothetical protein [Ruminococcus sp.]
MIEKIPLTFQWDFRIIYLWSLNKLEYFISYATIITIGMRIPRCIIEKSLSIRFALRRGLKLLNSFVQIFN